MLVFLFLLDRRGMKHTHESGRVFFGEEARGATGAPARSGSASRREGGEREESGRGTPGRGGAQGERVRWWWWWAGGDNARMKKRGEQRAGAPPPTSPPLLPVFCVRWGLGPQGPALYRRSVALTARARRRLPHMCPTAGAAGWRPDAVSPHTPHSPGQPQPPPGARGRTAPPGDPPRPAPPTGGESAHTRPSCLWRPAGVPWPRESRCTVIKKGARRAAGRPSLPCQSLLHSTHVSALFVIPSFSLTSPPSPCPVVARHPPPARPHVLTAIRSLSPCSKKQKEDLC